MTRIISLGGIGGCQVAQAMRNLDQPAFPYDWLVAAQSFVIRSFNRPEMFFTFDSKNVYKQVYLINEYKDAIMLHDFVDFTTERQTVVDKYKRRFDRLNLALKNDDILFVRAIRDLRAGQPDPEVFAPRPESMPEWRDFIMNIQEKGLSRKLLVITADTTICLPECEHFHICYVQNANAAEIKDVIESFLRDMPQ